MTFKKFLEQFPDDQSCLEYIFRKKYPDTYEEYYPISGRKGFANGAGMQIYPLVGTIFEKSDTDLTKWFYAIYLFSVSKNGVSGKELQRQLGVTYKTAWRMATQIRKLMEDGNDPLSGIVEVDEAYVPRGGNTSTILGMVERGGNIRTRIIPREKGAVMQQIQDNVDPSATIMSDMSSFYSSLRSKGYKHWAVNHGQRFVHGRIHINTLEGFWGQFKRSVYGTYHSVSEKYLQSYLNEFSFRYNFRHLSVFDALMERI